MTEAAEADLADIWTTLALRPSRLPRAFSRLCKPGWSRYATFPSRDFPQSGTRRELLAPGLRAVFHAPYAIYYKVSDDAVIVVRVIHGARDIAAIAEHGRLA